MAVPFLKNTSEELSAQLPEIENVEEWVAEGLDYNNQDFEHMYINLAELALWNELKRFL